jgi:TRAP-type transport system periplasmic protein
MAGMDASFKRRAAITGGVAALATAALPKRRPRAAPEVTLRLHHFLPPSSTFHRQMGGPWAERVQTQSQGRIAVEIYPTMQLGGSPPALFDQARDGVVDVAWTLTGYTPGRFPRIEVMELPFLTASAAATSQAAHALWETRLPDELKGVKVLCVHAHHPGSLHDRARAVRTPADLTGMKLRAPTRVANRMLAALGAVPIGMPVPQVPEALSRGVIDGAMLPFEVALPLRIHELVDHHTIFTGSRGLYTSVFVFVMNEASYEALPDDLKAVIDANSGLGLARLFGEAMDGGEVPGLAAARERGNVFTEIGEAELQPWLEATAPVAESWVAEAKAAGFDGGSLVEEAKALVDRYAAA